MKISLRKKNIVSTETLHEDAQYDIDTAWRAYDSHATIATRLFGTALFLAAVGIGCFIAGAVLSNFVFFTLGVISYGITKIFFTLSRNHNKQSNEFNTLSMVYDLHVCMEQQELEHLEEVVLNEIHDHDAYFDKPSWLYGKPAEPKSQFEIET